MEFKLNNSIEILERTPSVLKAYLLGLSEEWLRNTEGENTWSPYDIVGHLIFGEKTDWMIRIKTILSSSENKLFEPFDRFAQLQENQRTPIAELLEEFSQLRSANIKELKSLNISKDHLSLEGVHPGLGKVTMEQLIATWVVHDLGHIGQISRVMSKQYKSEVGPWIDYLGVLKK